MFQHWLENTISFGLSIPSVYKYVGGGSWMEGRQLDDSEMHGGLHFPNLLNQ